MFTGVYAVGDFECKLARCCAFQTSQNRTSPHSDVGRTREGSFGQFSFRSERKRVSKGMERPPRREPFGGVRGKVPASVSEVSERESVTRRILSLTNSGFAESEYPPRSTQPKFACRRVVTRSCTSGEGASAPSPSDHRERYPRGDIVCLALNLGKV